MTSANRQRAKYGQLIVYYISVKVGLREPGSERVHMQRA